MFTHIWRVSYSRVGSWELLIIFILVYWRPLYIEYVFVNMQVDTQTLERFLEKLHLQA